MQQQVVGDSELVLLCDVGQYFMLGAALAHFRAGGSAEVLEIILLWRIHVRCHRII